MRATMYGCEIVWSEPIGSAASSYACARTASGTKSSRGTRDIAASTRSSSMPRARSCSPTIELRSDDSRVCHMGDQRGRDVGDALGSGVDADSHDRDDRVALDERAVAAAACVVSAAEIDELPPFGGRDEDLARFRIRERLPGAVQRVRVVEDRFVAACLPAVAGRAEAQLLALPAVGRVARLPPVRHLLPR